MLVTINQKTIATIIIFFNPAEVHFYEEKEFSFNQLKQSTTGRSHKNRLIDHYVNLITPSQNLDMDFRCTLSSSLFMGRFQHL
ncbi:hypothetical protein DERF_008211 [Dermatophagoides farinae]|uniref:Uncharacterized protein n=1 Tax=Dermatophagoides farinae TaxID=6954 RepID=A0A922L4H8_DERFA|nr:hypothetical protein DERF_008211 [Dermatophagoides farinae]